MPILNAHSVEVFSHSAEQTGRVGARLGKMLRRGDVLSLTGELGSGKTTLIKGLVRGWGSEDRVTSPTFVLVNVYRRQDGQSFYHLDAYRLESLREAEDLDLEWLMRGGVLAVEWAERVEPLLPADGLLIELRWIADEQRALRLTPHGERYVHLLDTLREEIYGG